MGSCSPAESEPAFPKTLGEHRLAIAKAQTCNVSLYQLCGENQRQMGLGITPAVRQRCHWVKPVLIAQVKFTEWTYDDQLRQPVFLGLRTDKEAKNVVRE
jgi:bifunctional non-homologous end joining protein LigD